MSVAADAVSPQEQKTDREFEKMAQEERETERKVDVMQVHFRRSNSVIRISQQTHLHLDGFRNCT